MASIVVPLLNNIPCLFSTRSTTSNKSKTLFLPHKPNNNNKPMIKFKCSSYNIPTSSINNPELDHDEPNLCEVWKEIQGFNNWEGLLDPMNPHLRREIIRYGELAQACYDSFDFDPHSKYCGTCKYHPAHLFQKLNMEDSGYTITRYLYATSNINLPKFFQKSKIRSVWSPHANWMGYVAVATNEQEIKRLGRRDIGKKKLKGTFSFIFYH